MLTARTGRIAHSDRLVRVRMCEPRCSATKAAITLKFRFIRIDGGTVSKLDIIKKNQVFALSNQAEFLRYDKTVL